MIIDLYAGVRDTALRIGNAVPPPMYAGLVRDLLAVPEVTR